MAADPAFGELVTKLIALLDQRVQRTNAQLDQAKTALRDASKRRHDLKDQADAAASKAAAAGDFARDQPAVVKAQKDVEEKAKVVKDILYELREWVRANNTAPGAKVVPADDPRVQAKLLKARINALRKSLDSVDDLLDRAQQTVESTTARINGERTFIQRFFGTGQGDGVFLCDTDEEDQEDRDS